MKTNNIKLKNLWSIYNYQSDNQNVVLSDISFDIEPNKIYCLIGNSGCGKSTLAAHLNGLKQTEFGKLDIKDISLGIDYDLKQSFYGFIDYNDTIPIKINSKFQDHYKIKLIAHKSINSNKARIYCEGFYNLKNISKITQLSKITHNEFILFSELPFNNIKTIKNIDKEQIAKLMPLPNNFWLKTLLNRKIKKFIELRKTVGLVFQLPEYQIFKDTVLNDVSFGPLTLKINRNQFKNKKDWINYIKESSIDALKLLNMPLELLNQNPFELSGGQKRRVAIAGLLSLDCEYYIFDEPTAGLDPKGEQDLLNIIKSLKEQKNKTIIVITHNMDHVLQIADEVILLDQGKLLKKEETFTFFRQNENLLRSLGIPNPKIIDFINDLINQAPGYNHLWDKKPRDIYKLVQEIK